jgi:hypothetical protein
VREREDVESFRRRNKARVDKVGPCCSCLVTIVLIVLGLLWMLERRG